MRAVGHDRNILLKPARRMSLEEALEFIAEDELVEVTPDANPPAEDSLEGNRPPPREPAGIFIKPRPVGRGRRRDAGRVGSRPDVVRTALLPCNTAARSRLSGRIGRQLRCAGNVTALRDDARPCASRRQLLCSMVTSDTDICRRRCHVSLRQPALLH